MSDTAELNLRWAYALVDGMVSAGLRRVVISPGSRSTPLVLACARHPDVATWVQIDERSAAFFALGLAKTEGEPAAVIATSGSAPTHWYPAITEANHSATPLLALRADRPPELQDCGANQTIDQTRLFGTHVRTFHQLMPPSDDPRQLAHAHQLGIRALRDCLSPLPGPVHVNIPFREPLVPRTTSLPPPAPRLPPGKPARPRIEISALEAVATALGDGPGIIVCGPEPYPAGFAAAVTELATRLGAPVLADPLSGLRFGRHAQDTVLAHYDGALIRPDFSAQFRPQWVLRFGAFPVSKRLSRYLEGCADSRHFLVDGHGRRRDPLHLADGVLISDPEILCHDLLACDLRPAPPDWLTGFVQAERRIAGLSAAECVEAGVIDHCLDRLPDGSRLFCSNSLAIRDLDSFSGCGTKRLQIVGNRGVSGIDGNLSTLLGLATAGESPGTLTLGLIGDLAFFHDLSGLGMAAEQNVIIVLFNNSGGGIFRHLPQAGLEDFERFWLTPTGLAPAQAARLYGLHHEAVDDAGEFASAFDRFLDLDGTRILEVRIDPERSLAARHAYQTACAQN